MGASLDISELQDAVRKVLSVSKKTEAEVVNKTALKIVIGAKGVRGAIQLTPKASKESIRAVPAKVLRSVVAKKLKRIGRNVTKQEFAKLVKREMMRRIRSAGYTGGPGWDKAARAFGGRGVKRQAGFERSEAAKGGGTQATLARLTAQIENAAPAAAKIGSEALQKAVENVTADMVAYWETKVQQAIDKS